jgi:WD40 repeat protein
VRRPDAKWDKKTTTCYESAEEYAMQHNKGIWRDPDFANSLKAAAQELIAAESAEPGSIKWRFLQATAARAKGEELPAVESLTFSPDGSHLLVALNGRTILQLLDTKTLQPLQTYTAKKGEECCPVGFTSDGQAWLLSVTTNEKGCTNRLVNLATRKEGGSFQTKQPVRVGALNPNGKMLAVVTPDNTTRVALLDVTTGKETKVFVENKGTVDRLTYSWNGKILEGRMELKKVSAQLVQWDAQSGRIDAVHESPTPWSSPATELVSSPDGKLLGLLFEKQVRVYETKSRKKLAAPTGGGKASALAFSKDMRLLAIGDENGGVTLWLAFQ